MIDPRAAAGIRAMQQLARDREIREARRDEHLALARVWGWPAEGPGSPTPARYGPITTAPRAPDTGEE
jgi:hypothetical protein